MIVFNRSQNKGKLVALICLLISLFGGIAFSNTNKVNFGGSVAEANTIVIATHNQLADFASKVNSGEYKTKNVRLSANIDLGEKIWTPIGTSSNKYQGVFDGNGYTISNLKTDTTITDTEGAGLFGFVNGATIKDLVFKNTFINSYATNIGAIVGHSMGSTTISNIAVIGGIIQSGYASGGSYIGGIVGCNTDALTVNNSYSTARLVNATYVSGIVGYSSSERLGVYNTYFSGEVEKTSNYSTYLIGGSGSVYNSYYLYYGHTNASTRTYIYGRYNYNGVRSGGSNSSLPNAESFVKGIDISTVFNNPNQATNALFNYQNNWVKDSSESPFSQFPILRGVGNKTIAVKNGTSLSDYANSNNVVNVSSMETTQYEIEIEVSADERVWGNYETFLKLSGSGLNKESLTNGMIITNSITGRGASGKNLTIEANGNANRQGYVSVKFYDAAMLYAHEVKMQNIINSSTNLTGVVSFYNSSGELHIKNANETFTNVSERGWSSGISINSSVTIYTSKGTTVGFHATPTALDTGNVYHSLFIKTNYTGNQKNTINQSNYTATLNYNGTSDDSDKKSRINLLVSNLYEFSYPSTNNSADFLNGKTNYGGLGYSSTTSTSNIYLAVNKLENDIWTWYERDGSEDGVYNYKQKQSNSTFAEPKAKGWEFENWSYNNEINLSKDKTSLNDLLDKGEKESLWSSLKYQLTTTTKNGKSYTIHSSTPKMLYAKWTEQEHEIEFFSYLNINDEWAKNKINELLKYNSLPYESFFQLNGQGGFGDDVKVGVEAAGKSLEAISGGISKIQTATAITVSPSQNSKGIEFQGVIIYNKNGNNRSYNSFGGTTATLASGFVLGGVQWYKNSGRDSVKINHLHGDIGIIVLFKRTPTQITIEVNPTLKNEEAGEDDFKMQYSILEVNGEEVNGGSLFGTTGKSMIEGIRVGQQVVFHDVVLREGLDFSDTSRKFIADETVGVVKEGVLRVDDENGIFWVVGLEESLGLTTGLEDGDIDDTGKKVKFNVPLRYKGMVIDFVAGREEGGVFKQFTADDNNPTFSVHSASNENEQELTAIVVGNQVRNLNQSGEVQIKLTGEFLYSWGGTVEIYIDGVLNNKISLDIERDSYSDILTISSFGGLAGVADNAESIEVRFVFTKTLYQIELEVEGDGGGTITYDGQNKIENAHYDKEYKISINASDGYKINSVNFGDYFTIVDEGQATSSYEYTLKLFEIALIKNNTERNYKIKASFQAKQTIYIIEHYYEAVNGDFLNEEEHYTSITKTIEFGTNVTLGVADRKNKTGFLFNEEKSATGGAVAYAEDENDDNITRFKLYYNRQKINVEYNANSGSGEAPAKLTGVKFGTSFDVADNTFTHTGKTYSHWSTNSSGTGGSNFNPNDTVEVTTDLIGVANGGTLILYAQWSANKYQVEYEANEPEGESGNITGQMSNSEHTYGVSKTLTINAFVLEGWNFIGWNTKADGTGDEYENEASVLNLTTGNNETITLYAQWEGNATLITFSVNLVGASGNFLQKNMYIGKAYGAADTNGENQGFPEISNHSGFELIGWWTSDKVNQGDKIEETTIISSSSATILYAHWKLATPVIESPANWASTQEFDGSIKVVAEIKTDNSAENAYISNYNENGQITYKYQWYKLGNEEGVQGQTESQLKLTNVNQSGKYRVKVTPTNVNWGEGEEAYSEYVTVTIEKQQLEVKRTLTNGKISKIYDGSSQAFGVSSSDSSVFGVVANYENAEVGDKKQVIFTVTFLQGKLPGNYTIMYGNNPQTNGENAPSFSFSDSEIGEIKKRDLKLMIGDQIVPATGQNHIVEAEDLEMSEADRVFLLALNQELEGSIETISNLPGTYVGNQGGFVNNLDIKDGSTQSSKINNYNVILDGQVKIDLSQTELKTVIIEKIGKVDKDDQNLEQAINGKALKITVDGKDISSSGTHSVDGLYARVINSGSSSSVIIIIDQAFNGIVTVATEGFPLTVDGVDTTALAVSWQGEGIDNHTDQIELDFSKITSNSNLNIKLTYQNFSVIKYDTRLEDVSLPSQSVYNTTNGIDVSHQTPTVDGLNFLGWFDSTLATAKEIASVWKGVGEITVFAKWQIQDINIELKHDETVFVGDVNTTYDGVDHTINANIVNKNTENIAYEYIWTVNSRDINQGQRDKNDYTFKNAGTYTIKLVVKARVNYVGESSSSLIKEITKEFKVVVGKFKIEKAVELDDKIFDNNTNLNIDGNEYYILEINFSQSITEKLLLTATYASKDVQEQAKNLTDINLTDYEGFLASNFYYEEDGVITISVTGKIIPKQLGIININAVENMPTKVYDGEPLEKQIRGKLSENLITGHELVIEIKTKNSDAGIYDAGQGQIEFLNIEVFEGASNITHNYAYLISNIIGEARIAKAEIDASKIKFEQVNSFMFDGKEKNVEVSLEDMPGGKLPPFVTGTYTWYKQGEQTPMTGKPIYVGTYRVVYSLEISDTNYTIIGTQLIEKTIEITKRQITVDIGDDNTFENQGIKTISVEDQEIIKKIVIRNYEIVEGHTLKGAVSTSGPETGIYSSDDGNLVHTLYVEDSDGKNISENYSILILGSIKIDHKYTIYFYPNTGSGNMLPQIIESSGAYNLKNNTFAKEGYVFIAWNTSPDGDGTIYENQQAIPEPLANHGGEVHLYASWGIGQSIYYLEYYIEDLEGAYQLYETNTIMIDTESYVVYERNVNALDKYYYTYKEYENKAAYEDGEGWINSFDLEKEIVGFSHSVNGSEILEGEVTPASSGESLAIKLYLTRNIYDVTFHPNNGEGFVVSSFKYQQDVIRPTDPVRKGYTFTGWSRAVDGETRKLEFPYQMPAEDFETVAVYTARTDTAFNVEIHYQNKSGHYNDPDDIIVERQTLTGITDGFVRFDFESGKAILQMFDSDSLQLKQANMFEVELAKVGFEFDYEYLESVYEGVISADSENTLTLLLHFKRNIYTFTKEYHDTQTSDTQTIETQQIYHGNIISRPSDPVYEGYAFEGWYLQYDIETKTYSQKINVWNFEITEDITIHAKYTPNTNTSFKLNIYQEGLDGQYQETPNYEFNDFKSTTGFTAKVVQKTPETGNKYFGIEFYDGYGQIQEQQTRIPETDFSAYGFVIDENKPAPSTKIENDGSGVINLYLARQEFTLKIDTNQEGVGVIDLPVKYEHSVHSNDLQTYLPDRENFTFGGWYESSSFLLSEIINFPIVIKSDLTIYARWYSTEEVPVTVEYYLQNVNSETMVVEGYPETPQITETLGLTQGAYIFVEEDQESNVNWLLFYIGVEGEERQELLDISKNIGRKGYEFDTYDIQGGYLTGFDIVIEGTIIKIYYTVNSYQFTINFEDDETPSQEQDVYFGEKPLGVQDPVRIGYVFEGWFTNKFYENAYNHQSFQMPAMDFEIYAKWSAAPDTKFVVEYYQEILNPEQTEKQFVKFGEQEYKNTTNYQVKVNHDSTKIEVLNQIGAKVAEHDILIFSGFTFDLANSQTVSQTSIFPDSSAVLKLYFNRNQYTLKLIYGYSQDDIDFAGAIEEENFDDLFFEQQQNIEKPVRVGYEFNGWFIDQSRVQPASLVVVDNDTYGYVMTDKDTTLYAGWKALGDTQYIVNYHLQNIGDDGFEIDSSKTLLLQGKTDSVVTGERFVIPGFTYDPSQTAGEDSGKVGAYPENKLTLNLYYTRNVYTLNFDGGVSASGTTPSMSFKYQETKNLIKNEFSRLGYYFNGWTEIENSGNVKYQDEKAYTFTAERDMTLYADWKIRGITDIRVEADKAKADYGNKITLEVFAEHEGQENAVFTYMWHKLVDGLPKDIGLRGKTLTITEISESGIYLAYVKIQLESGESKTERTVNEAEVEILPRKIKVEWDKNIFTYSAKHQAPMPKIVTLDSQGNPATPENQIVLPSILSIQLFSGEGAVEKTINIGTYTASALVQENSNFNVLENQDCVYEINKLQWEVQLAEGHFRQQYDPYNVKYNFDLLMTNNTTGEQVEIYLERLDTSNEVGFYDLSLKQEQSNNPNYLITIMANSSLEIYKSSDTALVEFINTDFIKIYDGHAIDIIDNPLFSKENLRSTNIDINLNFESARFEIVNNSANVGSYLIKLSEAVVAEYGEVLLVGRFYFTIQAKQVDLDTTGLEIVKTYDGSPNWQIGNDKLIGVIEEDRNDIEVPIKFTTSNAGNDIEILKPTLQGAKAINYKLSSAFENLKGSILQRNVKVSAIDETIVYGDYSPGMVFDFHAYLESLSQQGVYEDLAPSQIFSGSLLPDFTDGVEEVGTYNLGNQTLNINANYKIEIFESATLTVERKILTLTSDSWSKIYDGSTEFLGNIELHGILDRDKEKEITVIANYTSATVGKQIKINFELVGEGSSNYVLSDEIINGDIEKAYVTAFLNYNLEPLESLATPTIGNNELTLVYGEPIQNHYQALPTASVVGYNFVGWFVEVGGIEIQITPQTVIDENIGWHVDEKENEFFAKWEQGEVTLTVNVILVESQNPANNTILRKDEIEFFNQAIVTMNGASITEGNVFTLPFASLANIVASSNADYDYDYIFDGWFFSPQQYGTNPVQSNEIFEVELNNLTINMKNNFEVFAKFKLKSAVLKLNFNADGQPVDIENEFFSWNIEWQNQAIIGISKEFDSGTLVDLPQVLSTNGYDFVGWFEESNPENIENPLTQLEVVDEVMLYAVWQAQTFTARFIADTGGEIDQGQKHFDNGRFEGSQTQFEKEITYNQVFGTIETAIRGRYTFAGWYDNEYLTGNAYNEESVWQFLEDKTFYAKWDEVTYTVEIKVSNPIGGEVEIIRNQGILNVDINQTPDSKTYIVQLKTSAVLNIFVKTNKGYKLSVADYSQADFELQIEDVLENANLTASRFAKAEVIDITFKANLNIVKIQTNNLEFGDILPSVENMISESLRTQTIDDDLRVEKIQEGQYQVSLFTGEVISIASIANIGYLFDEIINITQNDFGKAQSGSYQINANKIEISQIYQDEEFEVKFVEQEFKFEVRVGKDITTDQTQSRFGGFVFAIIDKDGNENIIETNVITSGTANVKTGEKLKIYITPSNGFAVVQDISRYALDFSHEVLPSANINFGYIIDNIIIIENIFYNNSITLVFERLLKTLYTNIVLMDKDGNVNIITENLEEVAEVEILTQADRGDTEFYFETQVDVTAKVQENKYTFVGWARSLSATIDDTNKNHTILMDDDINVYLVVRLNTYLVNYSVEGSGRLSIGYNQLQVEHGHDLEVVEAINDRGHGFVKWEIYNEQLEVWEQDLVQTQSLRKDTNIESNLKIRAVFEPNQVKITIKSILITGYDEAGEVTYFEGQQQIGEFSLVGQQEWFTGKEIHSFTGESFELDSKVEKGYEFVGWNNLSGIRADRLDNNKFLISGYFEDITITAVFEAKENNVTIGFVVVEDDLNGDTDYEFQSQSLTQGGKLLVTGNNVIGLYTEKAIAKTRTNTTIEFIATLDLGYKLNVHKGLAKAVVGIRDAEGNFKIIQDNIIYDVGSGRLEGKIEAINQDLTVVVYIELIEYEVDLFVVNEEDIVDSRTIIMTVRHSLTAVLESADLLTPQRRGHDFLGWYSTPNSYGIINQIINANGDSMAMWKPEMTDLYAYWQRKAVKINITYEPGGQGHAFSASQKLGYPLANLDRERSDEYNVFYYYVGTTTQATHVMFSAPNPLPGYEFVGWFNGDKLLTDTRDFSLLFNIDYNQLEVNLRLVYSVGISVIGTSNGEGFIEQGKSAMLLPGETAQLSVTPNPGYEFVEWLLNGTHYSPNPNATVAYQSHASTVRAVFRGKLVEVIINQTIGGTHESVSADGEILIAENNKLYARMGQVLTFVVSAELGKQHTGFIINSVTRNIPNYAHTVSVDDVNRGNITITPIFSLKGFSYFINFTEGANAMVENQIIKSGEVHNTDYFSTITFSFWASERYKYSEIYLMVNGIKHEIKAEYIQLSGDAYIVNMPSNLFDVEGNNSIEIKAEKLYWLDIRQQFEGVGTESNPYIISNAAQFAQMAFFVNNNVSAGSGKVDYIMAHYVLISGVDFGARFWVPIGTEENPFNGTITLDYGRYNIVLDQTYPRTEFNGLFGYITKSANIIVKKVEIVTGILIIGGVIVLFIGVIGVFVLIRKSKRKKMIDRSRAIPTERNKGKQ